MIRQVKEEKKEKDTLKGVENPREATKIDSNIQREVTEEQEVAIIIIGVEITSREVEEAQIIIGVTATIIVVEVITTEVAMVAVTLKVEVVATATIIKEKKKIVITTTLPLIHWKETILKTTTINHLLDQK